MTQLLDAGLVDELCLSTSPVLTSGERSASRGHPTWPLSSWSNFSLDDDGGLYARWTVMRDRA